MRRFLPWAALGLGCYLLFLAATAPAHFVWQRFAPPDTPAASVSGTVWRGQAQNIASNPWGVREVRWRFAPVGLLRLRANWRVEAALDGGSLQALANPRADGSLRLWEGRMQWSLQQALAAAGYGGLNGALELDLDRLVLQDLWPSELQGALQLYDLRIAEFGAYDLGDFTVQLDARDGAIVGDIRNRGGVVEIAAQLNLYAPLNYRLEGQMRPRPGAPAELGFVLSLFGIPDAQGWTRFAFEDRL